MSEVSKLQVYSIGIVAANKALSSKDIEVTPIEDLPMIDGELTDSASETSSKAADSDGAAYQTQVPTSLTVQATWLPFGNGNRLTAPDVRRGERVILYRYADHDKFWWVTQGQDMRLRKLETVIWGISATKDESVTPDADSMYWIEWSSHKKLIHIHTSKVDGEPYTYDIQLNTKDGAFIFQDDNGQKFSLDSRERIWRVENRDGSYVEVNKREIYEHAPDLIRRTSKRIEDIADETILVKSPRIDTLADKTTLKPILRQWVDVFLRAFARVTEDVVAPVRRDDDSEQNNTGVSLVHHIHPENDNGGPTSPPINPEGDSGAGGTGV